MFHVKQYDYLFLKEKGAIKVQKAFITPVILSYYISTKLFFIANTAACVLSATSIFLNMLEI